MNVLAQNEYKVWNEARGSANSSAKNVCFTKAPVSCMLLIFIMRRVNTPKVEGSYKNGTKAQQRTNFAKRPYGDECCIWQFNQPFRKTNSHFALIRIPGLDGSRKRKQLVNTVELDVDDVEVPVGQWQVVVKHVPKGRHIFIRFALGSEVRQSIINPYKQEVTENPSNPDADAGT